MVTAICSTCSKSTGARRPPRRQIGIRGDTRARLSNGLQRASELRPLPTNAAHRLIYFSSIVGAAQPREWLSMTFHQSQ